MAGVWSVAGLSPLLRRRIIQAANDQGMQVPEWLEQVLGPQVPTAETGLAEVLAAIDKCLADIGRGRESAADAAPPVAAPMPAVGDDGAWGQVVSLEARRRRFR